MEHLDLFQEVQLLRTAVRYGKVDDVKDKMYSFFWFTNLVIDFCDHLRKNLTLKIDIY